IVTERMPGVRSVTLGVWVAAGSRDERLEIAGASHFLEHLLFKGTPSRSARDIAEAFEAVGGDLNAFTAKENTCFYARVLDRDQVKRFYKRHYVPANFVVVTAGNLEHDDVVQLVQQGIEAGRVKGEGASAWRLREARDAPKPSGATLVRKRATEQAHICYGT